MIVKPSIAKLIQHELTAKKSVPEANMGWALAKA